MILVTGAAGKTGRAVIAALARREERVRALVHRAEQIAAVKVAGAAEVVVGDMLVAQDVQGAAQGVRAIYHIAPNMTPHEVEMAEIVLPAGAAAGVSHFVYHSVLHPQTEAMPHHWHKLRVEAMLFASDLPFTILQPAAYMQNILGSWASITDAGIYPVPYPVATRLSLVDLVDVGEAAATVLTEPGHVGATYELVGTRPLAQTEVAETLSEVLSRPVRAAKVPLDQWQREAETAGLSRYAVETLLKMFRYYAANGFAGNPNVLAWFLGRAPTSLAEFVRRQEM